MTIEDVIRERGPLTVAAFMDLALYDPALGYYARAAQRSGRAGDFFTSVDVGPLFGELLAEQIGEMAALLAVAHGRAPKAEFDLVEAGAGNGRLSADILKALQASRPDTYTRTALHLVERSAAARAAQQATLGVHASRVASSSADLPESFEGVLIANELLDALPVHQVVMRDDGLKEVYVRVEAPTGAAASRLTTAEGPLSTPALGRYLDDLGVALERGWRVEIGLAAADWVRTVARRLGRGFIVLVDYGHEARELYSVTHSSGTLMTYSRHVARGAERPAPDWLQHAGEQDITAHVDFSTVQKVAHAEGLTTVALLDQTYFVLGVVEALQREGRLSLDRPERRRAVKTLSMPGGLGSTMKVLILGKGIGTPALVGCSFGGRLT